MAVVVTDNKQHERFEIHVDGELAGFAEYQSQRGIIAFMHTEIEPGFQGQGLAGQLIGESLDAAAAADMHVLPFCPFVLRHIQKHDKYRSLVPADLLGRFDLA